MAALGQCETENGVITGSQRTFKGPVLQNRPGLPAPLGPIGFAGGAAGLDANADS